MNKPEKRILNKESPYLQYDKGFNHCWCEWERYHDEEISAIDHWGEEWKKSYDKVLKKLNNLPSEEEIVSIIDKTFGYDCSSKHSFLAKAIYKRIKGE